MINEKQIDLISKCWILSLAVLHIEQSMSSIIVIDHHLLIFRNVFQEISSIAHILIFPHLQNVDDLPEIRAG
jgi:hypothetical protein